MYYTYIYIYRLHTPIYIYICMYIYIYMYAYTHLRMFLAARAKSGMVEEPEVAGGEDIRAWGDRRVPSWGVRAISGCREGGGGGGGNPKP